MAKIFLPTGWLSARNAVDAGGENKKTINLIFFYKNIEANFIKMEKIPTGWLEAVPKAHSDNDENVLKHETKWEWIKKAVVGGPYYSVKKWYYKLIKYQNKLQLYHTY